MADADDEDAPSALALLPRAIVLLAFAPLPVDLRARCACVCRGWHAALLERALWTRLDVSRTSGVTGAVTDAFLRGAAARAGGALQTLDVSGSNALSLEALLEVATANAATLRQLRVCHGCNMYEEHFLPFRHAMELLRAAPQLRVFDIDVGCDGVAHARDTLRIRRKKGLLAPLRIRGLCFNTHRADEAALLALAADVASHAWLRTLCVSGPLRTPAALDAVVDAALTRRLAAVHFVDCGLVPASAPALARLLGGSSLEELLVLGNRYAAALLDAPAAALLASALRANMTLKRLHLESVDLWHDVAAASTLLGELTAHPSVRTLCLAHNSSSATEVADRVAAGAALGALLAADAPALTELDVEQCNLGDAGVAPLLEALPRNTHIRTLKWRGGNDEAAVLFVAAMARAQAHAAAVEAHAAAAAAAAAADAAVAALGPDSDED
jgi:hypothetical protein